MSLIIRALNFIGYRCVNAALYLDNVHHYPKAAHEQFLKDDPYDMKRTDYPLCKSSIIVDVGGFTGDWAARMYCLYSCWIDIFEAHPDLSKQADMNFKHNNKVWVYGIGLGRENTTAMIYGNNMNASLFKNDVNGTPHRIQIRKTSEMFNKLYGNKRIDLLKVNVEGAEYDILPDLIEGFDMKRIENILIQFHNVVPDFRKRKNEIEMALSKTHDKVWEYDMIWVSYTRKQS